MAMSKFLRKRNFYLQRLSKRKPSSEPNNLGTTLLKYRIEKNLTQSQLSEILGCHLQQVAVWEKGKHIPMPARQRDIKRRLGLEPLQYCEIGNCNEDAEKSHLITRGVLPKELWDDEVYFMWMCRRHHQEFHSMGADSFCAKYGIEERLAKARLSWAEYH